MMKSGKLHWVSDINQNFALSASTGFHLACNKPITTPSNPSRFCRVQHLFFITLNSSSLNKITAAGGTGSGRQEGLLFPTIFNVP